MNSWIGFTSIDKNKKYCMSLWCLILQLKAYRNQVFQTQELPEKKKRICFTKGKVCFFCSPKNKTKSYLQDTFSNWWQMLTGHDVRLNVSPGLPYHPSLTVKKYSFLLVLCVYSGQYLGCGPVHQFQFKKKNSMCDKVSEISHSRCPHSASRVLPPLTERVRSIFYLE